MTQTIAEKFIAREVTAMERPRWRINNLSTIVLYAVMAIGTLLWAAVRWPRGLSLFGFESPFWDLGLLPLLIMLALGHQHQGEVVHAAQSVGVVSLGLCGTGREHLPIEGLGLLCLPLVGVHQSEMMLGN